MCFRLTHFLFLPLLFPSQAAIAHEAENNFQLWPTFRLSAAIAKLELTGDAILLFTDDASRLGQSLFRGVATYNLTDQLSAGAGYTFTTWNLNATARQTEHRIVQDLIYRPSLGQKLAVTLRVRAEERFRESEIMSAIRIRVLTRFELPVSLWRIRAVAWNETFYGVNGTNWSPVGATLSLSFAGVNFPLSEQLMVEPGYLNSRSLSLGEPDIRHIFSVTMHWRI